MPEQKIQYDRNTSKVRPRDIDDDLIKQCREFLAVEVPSSNVVFADEFNKFMPLFNKSLYESTDQTEIDRLAREYNSTFSMQHPIQVPVNLQKLPFRLQGEPDHTLVKDHPIRCYGEGATGGEVVPYSIPYLGEAVAAEALLERNVKGKVEDILA